MKNILRILFLLCFSFVSLKGNDTLIYQVQFLEKFQSEEQLIELLDSHKTTMLLVIQDQIYMPDKYCLCGRHNDNKHLDRMDDSYLQDRSNSNDEAVRKFGDDQALRDRRMDLIERYSDEQWAFRLGQTDLLFRNSNGQVEDRKTGSDDLERNAISDYLIRHSDEDEIHRASKSDFIDISCRFNREKCEFELIDVNPNAEVKVFNKNHEWVQI